MFALRATIQPCPNTNSFSIGLCHILCATLQNLWGLCSSIHASFQILRSESLLFMRYCRRIIPHHLATCRPLRLVPLSMVFVTLFWTSPAYTGTIIVKSLSFRLTFPVKGLAMSLANQPTTMHPFKLCANACRAEPLILWQRTPPTCCIWLPLVAGVLAVKKSASTLIWVRHWEATMPSINIAIQLLAIVLSG